MKNLQVDFFTNYQFPHSIKVKDELLAYAVTSTNLEENKYNTDIWIHDLRKNYKYQLTNSKNESGFLFLDNGNIMLFSDREGKKEKNKTKLYTIDPKGGEAREFLSLDLIVSDIKQIDEENFIILGYEYEERNSDFHEINTLPFWLNGAGYNYDKNNSLYLYNKKDNLLEKITKREKILGLELSKDRKKVVFSFKSYDDLMPQTNDLAILNLDNREYKTISHDNFSYRFYDFINDDQDIIFIGTDMKKHGINEDSKVFTMKIDGSQVREISDDDFDMAFFNSVGTDSRFGGGSQIQVKDDKLFFIATSFDHAYLYSLDLDGKVQRLIDLDGSVEMFYFWGEKIVYSAMEDLNLPEIFISDFKDKKKITDFSQVLSGIKLSPIEKFSYENDGISFDGYVIKPIDYIEGKSYPGILEIHGGPKTAYGTIFHHEMQVLANLGYFVFYTNPRGSSGRGVEFSDIRGKYGTIDYNDLMKFTDQVLEIYKDIDSNRLGVLGGSYGGFMTNWIISHTDRFKAANTQRSISNWTSFYGVSDIGYYFAQDQNQSTPWNNFELLWESSPLKHMDKAKTPTLVIHSDEDYRCPLEQGIQVFNALKVNGVDSKLVIFNGENHELSRSGKPQSRIKRLEEIINWFDKYLGI